MPRREIIAFVFVILSTGGAVAAALGYESYLAGQRNTLELKAQAPERGNWLPRELVVSKDEMVRLRIRNIDTVSHGFALPDFGVGIPEIKPGHAKIVTFKPDRAGTFPFMCTVWCSKDHMAMSGRLLVRAKEGG